MVKKVVRIPTPSTREVCQAFTYHHDPGNGRTTEEWWAFRDAAEVAFYRWLDSVVDKYEEAIDSVMDRHQPSSTGVEVNGIREPDFCQTCGEYWPCMQYQDIERALTGEYS